MPRSDLQSFHIVPHVLHIHADLSGPGECQQTGPSAVGHVEVQTAIFDVRLASFSGPNLNLPDVLILVVLPQMQGQADPKHCAA
ncbi:hypothetical protein P8935_13790 [Telmatobacter sp. DSM 110680]|uniref:Uncharacterized protein n=1 Tax=Telmatobacter sp. DSM 110680 TaxID=3036704 RepID=A0AAU7DE33_9BACT